MLATVRHGRRYNIEISTDPTLYVSISRDCSVQLCDEASLPESVKENDGNRKQLQFIKKYNLNFII